MKKLATLILLAFATMFGATNVRGQNSYYESNKQAHAAILGTEPEEFLKDRIWYTSQGNVEYNTDFVNGLHAIFTEDNSLYNGGKSAVLTKFGAFTSDESNTINGNLAYGIQIDTLINTIKDMDNNLIDTFTDYLDLYNKMYNVIDEIGRASCRERV